MKRRQLDALRAYVQEVQNWLGLNAWEIEVFDEEPGAPDARAAVTTTEGRYHAVLRVAPSFLRAKPASQRQSIVHELLHVAAREQNDVIRASGLSAVLGQDAYTLVWESYKAAHERLTDHLATVVAGFAPLPQIPRQ